MVWDVLGISRVLGSHGPREDIPPPTPDQSEKPIVFRERILSRIQRKPDEDVDTTLLFPNSVTQGVCRNTYDGLRLCALARLISHTHSEKT
ncbi:hypothetical protein TNCV_4758401 [Trichonephila clavipes]|nr:hypothetical protein TNCV_4758401 [Trichonephila clavipes]